jgi:hypothetical protein
MAQKIRRCVKCNVELDFKERTYCFICQPGHKCDKTDATPEWREWNDAIYRED